jgi:VanZ family protein
LPLVAWMGVIFFFSAQSSLPSPEDDLLNFIVKKSGHLTEYAVLMVLWLHAVTNGPIGPRHVVFGLVFVFLYGLSDEYHQTFTANRTPLFTDVLIDTVGGVLGWLVWCFARRHGWLRRWHLLQRD